jgi:hypothetical protein
VSCVLRISGPLIPATLRGVSIAPYRVENMTAHFSASEAPNGDLGAQVRDVTLYLTSNRIAIKELMATPNASGELDFATEYEPGTFTSNTLGAALVRLAGELRLDLTVSGYPVTGEP